jgi:thioesterase domain-containing protein/acyl carrier protein
MNSIEYWQGTTDVQTGGPDGAQIFPMSSAQLGVWFTEQLAGASAANNLSFALRLDGKLNIAALEFSLLTVLLRHETLRTTFDLIEGRPVQIVRKEPPKVLTRVDLTQALDAEAATYDAVCQVAHSPFDLTRGPLLRVLLVEQGPGQNVLCCVMHHIIADGWSFGLFMSELAACYDGASHGRQPTLKPLRIRYTDCVLWEQQWLSSDAFQIQLADCVRPLIGAPPQWPLGETSGSNPNTSAAGASRAVKLPAELTSAMKSVAQRHGTTAFVLSLAAFQVLLSQITGQDDVVVGIAVARRNRIDVENIIGLFASVAAARAVLSGDPEFADALAYAKSATLNALVHEDIPFHSVVQALHPARTDGSNPMFRALFASVPIVSKTEEFSTLRATPYVVPAGGALYELSFSMIEDRSSDVWIRAEYRTELFEDRQIADLLDHYVAILTQIAARPHTRISLLAGLPTSWPARRQTIPGTACVAPPSPKPTETTQSELVFEEALVQIWQEVLRCQPPERDANFFDLGGDSLHAISIAIELGRLLGRSIPVSLVFREPTIQGMAQWLQRESGTPSGMLPIRLSGTRPPLFMGGSSSALRSLGRALGTDQPCYLLDIFALHEQQVLSGQALLATLPEIAARFVDEILAIQPAGPYFLAGQCEGGILALEIALQLQAFGRQVALLVILDTPVDGYFRLLPWARRIGNPTLMTAVALARAGNVPEILRRMKEQLFGRRSKKHPPATHRESAPEEQRSDQIWAAIWNAVRNYRQSARLAGEIVIFRAKDAIRIHEDTAQCWDSRAEHVRIQDVPGDHTSYLLEPITLQCLKEAIEEALKRTGWAERRNEQ